MVDYEGKLNNEVWFDAQSSFSKGPTNPNFNEVGDYRYCSNKHKLYFFDAKTFIESKEPNLDNIIEFFISSKNITIKTNEPEYELMKPLFN